MKKALIAALVVVALLFVFSGMNTVPRQDENVKAAWAQVENQFQRRADLIPNLVKTVKGYAAHERSTFQQVTDARASVSKVTIDAKDLNDPVALQKYDAAQGQLGSALSRLLAVSENYPNLKADKTFLSLQSQLEGTENRISVARRDYIAAVQEFNTTIRTFPGVLWGKIYGAQPKPVFKADAGADKVPNVDF